MKTKLQESVLIGTACLIILYSLFYYEPSLVEFRYDSLDLVQQFKKQYPSHNIIVESDFLHPHSIHYSASLGEKTASLRIVDFNGPLAFYICNLQIKNGGSYGIFQVFSPTVQTISDYPCEDTFKKDDYFVNTPPHVAQINHFQVFPVNLSLLAPFIASFPVVVFSIRLYLRKRKE